MAQKLLVFGSVRLRIYKVEQKVLITFVVAWSWLGLFPEVARSAALAAEGNLDLGGGACSTDSFDSADATHSTNGLYDPTKANTNGGVICLSGIVNVLNPTISGKLLLGTNAGYVIGPHGSISGGVQSNLDLTLAPVSKPLTWWCPSIPTNAVIDGVAYQYVFTCYDWPDQEVDYLSGGVYVETNAHIRLLVSGTGPGFTSIRVAGRGSNAGQLKIYADVATATVSGPVLVDSGDPSRLVYYGTTNNTVVTFSVNGTFVGTIAAPAAKILFGYGGSRTCDFVGTIEGQSIRIYNTTHFHFDENLWRLGYALPDIITQPQSQSVMVGQTVLLSVLAKGNVSYQWQRNGVNLSNATYNVFYIGNAAETNTGQYTVVLSNSAGVLRSEVAVVTVTNPPPVDTDGDGMADVWEVAYGFNPKDPSDALADADGDGFSNLLEYAVGGDPHRFIDGRFFISPWLIQAGGSNYLFTAFVRRKALPSGWQCVVEVSGDQQNWFSDGGHVQETISPRYDPEYEWLTARDLTPVTASGPRFLRVVVRRTTAQPMPTAQAPRSSQERLSPKSAIRVSSHF